MRHAPTAVISAAILAACRAASAQHAGDIGLRVTDGRIATAEISSGGYGEARRAFGATFGDTGVPWFTANPGFDALAGTFPAGTRLGFRFAGPLLAWDGDSFEPTSPNGPLAGERLRISFLTASATSGEGAVNGFDLAVQADGGWHRHLNMTLLAASGASAPEAGVYLARLELYSTAPGIASSEETWLVMGANALPEDFAAAFAAAESALNPPACPADLDGDGQVSGADLGALLGNWGMPGIGDLDGSGAVTGADLGALLGAWGPCP